MRWVWMLVVLVVVAAAVLVVRQAGLGLRGVVEGSAARSAAERNRNQIDGAIMGSPWSVKLGRPVNAKEADALSRQMQALLDRLELQLSDYNSESELSRFNAQKSTGWQSCSAELLEVLTIARQVSEKSAGAFDVTAGPLVGLWGFGPAAESGQKSKPSEAAVAQALENVSWKFIETQPAPVAIRKTQTGATIDLGAIGKGFAADVIGRKLDSMGINDYLIAVGGELRARGISAEGKDWRVGIETPTPDVRRVLLTLPLRNQSLSTSGDYRNTRELDGKQYCHEINPKTGQAIEAGGRLASVSVLHNSGALADAWATALYVLGEDKGFKLAEREGLAAVFVLRDTGEFEVRKTAQWKAVVGE